VDRALSAAGASWADVVRLMIYVTSTEGLAIIRQVRDECVDTTHPPVSSLIRIAGLAQDDWLLEVEAVAAIGT
jgi:enamine deaminase RidA (YjgF/YER057c/UK114 family)